MEDCVELDLEYFIKNKNRKPPTPRSEIIRAVVEYTIEGDVLNIYDSIKEAADNTEASYGLISRICHGTLLYSVTHKKIFLFRGDDIKERLRKIEKQQKKGKYIPIKRYYPFSIIEYSLEGKFLAKYTSAAEAAFCNNTTKGQIQKCCAGKKLFVNNKIFLHIKDQSIKARVAEIKEKLHWSNNKEYRHRAIDMYSIEGKYLKGFYSVSAAEKETKIHHTSIKRCCDGKAPNGKRSLTAGGYIFLWIGGSISDRLKLIQESKEKSRDKCEAHSLG